jgi:asparagine synthase (glutamine-hydrolysing)
VLADAWLDERDALKAQLGLPRDIPASDAELIAHAWLRWDAGCVDRLDGDFAFALHDPRAGGLFLARDRLGVRPLYFHHAPGRFAAFASGSTAVVAHPSVPRALNEGRIADFLVTQLEGIDKTSTFHEGVQRLPPAHWVQLGEPAKAPARYWSLQPASAPVPADDEAWAEALTELLERSVSRHLARPRRVGCMVSGGMDSSSLAAIAAQQLAARNLGPLPTFSRIDSRGPNVETDAIHAMFALPGFSPHLFDHVETGPQADALWATPWQVEEPFDALMMPIHAIYAAAGALGLDALIDGVDGDTPLLFGNGLARQLRQMRLRGAWRNARGLSESFGYESSALQLFSGAMRTALIPDALRHLRRRVLPRRPGPLVPAAAPISEEFARRIDLRARLQRLQAWHSTMPNWTTREDGAEDLEHPYAVVGLERYHRVAARHGIEPVHPLVDRRLLALCLAMPDRQRMADGWSKAVLRRAMQDRVPPAVLRRRDKQHLGWRQNRTLLERHRPWLLERLIEHRQRLAPYVAAQTLQGMESALATGMPDDAQWEQVFALAVLGDWLARQSQPPF